MNKMSIRPQLMSSSEQPLNIGDLVCFQDSSNEFLIGTLTRVAFNEDHERDIDVDYVNIEFELLDKSKYSTIFYNITYIELATQALKDGKCPEGINTIIEDIDESYGGVVCKRVSYDINRLNIDLSLALMEKPEGVSKKAFIRQWLYNNISGENSKDEYINDIYDTRDETSMNCRVVELSTGGYVHVK